MGNFFKAIVGNDWLSTAIGVGVGAMQAYGSHSIKQWAIALGIGLLGRVTNEVQAKYGSSNPQSGFARVPAMIVLAIMGMILMAAPAFAGVTKFAAKRVIVPVTKTVYHGGKQSPHAVKQSGKFAWKVLF
jgi:hypothetical protein